MKKTTVLIISFFLVMPIFANNISIEIARTIAKNFYYEKTNIKQNQINFEEETISLNNIASYYIFNIENDNGFVIISAEDNYEPILAYSLNNSFETENQPENVKYWLQIISDKITYIIQNDVEASEKTQNLWIKYNLPPNEFHKNIYKSIVVESLTNQIRWNQGNGWNALCPEDDAGPGGHVYAGCVATAMGIVMKYWNYPIQGSGSYGYTPSGYDYQFADYENTTYFWSYMEDNRPNYYSALLQYHLGISVDMMYSPGGSGAYSHDVPYALENYFGYSSNIEFIERYDYNDSEWITILQNQLDQAKPMYYSGCSNTGCHAFVCDGYDTDNYFHFNFGWGGSNNGFYLLDNVGGYSQWNGVVRNIEPPIEYLQPVANLNANLDFDTENTVNIEWETSKNKSITSYTLYRNEEIIAENISTSSSTFVDTDVSDGDYFYGVRAIYSDGQTICASDFLTVKNNFKIIIQVRKNNNYIFHSPFPTVNFNGETKTVNFIGEATFENVSLGENKNITITHEDYEPISDFINVNSDKKIIFFFDDYTNIETTQQEYSIYPNPLNNGILNIEGVAENSQILIYNITGKVVYQNVLHLNKINISNLQKGIYLLKIKDGDINLSEKIIIQ